MAPRSAAARTWKVRVRNERGVRRRVTGVIRRCHGFRSISDQASDQSSVKITEYSAVLFPVLLSPDTGSTITLIVVRAVNWTVSKSLNETALVWLGLMTWIT